MRLLRLKMAILLTLSMIFMTVAPGAGLALAEGAAFAVSGLHDVTYRKGDAPVLIAKDIIVENGVSYSDGYVKFAITNGTAEEMLSVAKVAQPSKESGKVSVVSSAVYLGDGTTATQIGSIHSLLNGEAGKALQFDFSTPLANGDFEGGTDAKGWTVNNNKVVLGSLASKTQGKILTQSGTGPYTMNGTANGQSYSYTTDKNYSGKLKEGMEENGSTGTFKSETTTDNGSKVLRLYFSGGVSSDNTAFGSVFGPEAISDTFEAKAGDALAFNWKAANGGDDYEIYGFLNNTVTGATYEILYGRGFAQNWKTTKGTIPLDGSYQFRFVAGSYDASGGGALGASLYIDDIRVTRMNPPITDTIIGDVAKLVSYNSTAFTSPEPTSRAVTITAKNTNNQSAQGTVNVGIVWQSNNVPVVKDAVYSVINTSVLTGTLNGTDADANPLTYRITSQPTLGNVVQSVYGGATFVYTPRAGATGSDTFTFVANDGLDDSSPATVSIRVLPSESSSGGGSAPTNGVQIIVDGIVQEQFATAKQEKKGDRSATIITVDNDKIIAKLEKEANKVVTIPVTGNAEVVIGELNGKL